MSVSLVRYSIDPGQRAFGRNARYYLDRLAGAADLNAFVASPLATKNLMDMLGIRGVEVDQVRTWSSTLMEGVADISGSEFRSG